jgi:hypothetical protein
MPFNIDKRMPCMTAEREAVTEDYRSLGEGEETGTDNRAFIGNGKRPFDSRFHPYMPFYPLDEVGSKCSSGGTLTERGLLPLRP